MTQPVRFPYIDVDPAHPGASGHICLENTR